MKQQTLAMAADRSFEKFRKQTKREVFLLEMEQVVPWARLVALIEPHYPKGEAGRPPVGVERMLRIYFCNSGSTSPIRGWKRRSAICR